MRSDSLKRIKRRAGRAEFFSIREELETKILLGHTLKNLYAEYVDRFSFGYVQFTRYVSRYCKKSRSFVMTGSHWGQK
ncbi:TraK family protein [Pseudomonas sp. NEEL19]|uniref:TraK family protein n=1 Tax=Pseudomonas sp. NEEL19 TaxID=2867409 RepID=UPI0027A8D6A1|nr:TraK family protein [Pseudomonas sp. NEEL19]